MNKKLTPNLTGNYSPQISGYTKLYKTLAALFLLFGIFIIGCKKDDFQGEVIGVCPIVTSDPMDKAVDVALDKVITITFNTVMNAATINNSTFTIKQNGNLVAGTIAPTTNSAVFTFKPAALLNPFLVYEGRVTTGVRDTLRTAMENDYVFTFTSIPQISVTASPLNAGTTTGSGNFAQGSTTTVTATPNTGFVFTNFTRNGVIVSTSSSYQFKVDGNLALVANFIPVPVGNSALTLSSSPPNGGRTTGQGAYPTGSVVTATAVANPGHTFMNWTDNGVLASTSSNYTFTLTGNRALVANFRVIPAAQFAVNLSSNPAVGGSTDGEGSYNANASVEVNAIPNADYNFVNWTENGVEVSRSTKYIFVLTATRNLVANFTLKTFTLNVTVVGGGRVDKNPNQPTYTTGSSVQLTATPNPGFQFTGWSVDASGSANPLTVLMDRNKNITATFVAIQFTLTVNAQNGTVDRNPNQPTYASGTTVQLTPRPDPLYEFVNWTGDASGSANPLPVLMDRNKIINANFRLIIIPPVAPQGPILPSLGLAGNYAILTKSGISTTGVTSITGNLGVSPAAATAITGFGLIMDANGQSSTSPAVTGKVFASDYAAPTPSNLTTAVSNMETAFTNSNNLTAPAPVNNLGAGNISGLTIPPGLYKFSTGVLITSQGVTLQGNANDTWVFTIAQDLTVNNTAKITLGPGVQAKNIYWVVSGQALLGTGVDFSGIILSQTLISLNTGARVNGRLLAQTAVTLNASTVIQPQ